LIKKSENSSALDRGKIRIARWRGASAEFIKLVRLAFRSRSSRAPGRRCGAAQKNFASVKIAHFLQYFREFSNFKKTVGARGFLE